MDSSLDSSNFLAGGRLTVDLDALTHNWLYLAGLARGAECAAAVKGDAYGTGLVPSARALWMAGCRTFFVALPSEALELRKVLPEAVVYVLNGLFQGAGRVFADNDFRPVLGSVEEIDEWRSFCLSEGRRLPAALHVDTGMNRLGLSMDEARHLANEGEGTGGPIDWALLMSHLACADTPDHPLNDRQFARFEEARALFPGLPASLANSAGILTRDEWHYDMVRPGVALYGGEAVAGRPNPMRPVAALEGRIVQVREVSAEETVGYGAKQAAIRPSRIALVSVGYADGYHRLLGSSDGHIGASAWIGEHECPLFGRVSMDLLAIDVTGIDPTLARRGGWVELIGPHNPVDKVAIHGETIGYELLTHLGPRYRRTYIGGAERKVSD